MICNDGFAKVLKPLKDIILRIFVPLTHSDKLFERSWNIIREEELKNVDHSLVRQIVD